MGIESYSGGYDNDYYGGGGYGYGMNRSNRYNRYGGGYGGMSNDILSLY